MSETCIKDRDDVIDRLPCIVDFRSAVEKGRDSRNACLFYTKNFAIN